MSAIYYVDFTNGSDDADGLTPTGDAVNGPWATINKFTSGARADGDRVVVRRGMEEDLSANVEFTTDGKTNNPLIVEADYDDVWGDFVDLSGTATATITLGSKVITFSADISAVLSAGDWIYASGDDTREYAYEVASVDTVTVNLYLPYKGDQMGSGKTMINMSSAPVWGEITDNYNFNFNSDDYWKIQGIRIRNTDYNGCVMVYNSKGIWLKDLIIEGNGSADVGIYIQGNDPSFEINKCRVYNCGTGISWTYSNGPVDGYKDKIRDCFIDCNNIINTSAGFRWFAQNQLIEECEVINYKRGISEPRSCMGGVFRNIKETATVDPYYISGNSVVFSVDDYIGVKGDSRVYYTDGGDATPVYQSETGVVRDGGSNTSIKVNPNTKMGSYTKANMIRLFEIPLVTTTDEKTYTIYFKSSATANWTDDPTADELFIELDYWCEDTNHYRRLKKSTGVLDFNGDADNWQALTVTVAPGEAGVSFLRCWYGKPLEDGVSNIFYVDPIPVIT